MIDWNMEYLTKLTQTVIDYARNPDYNPDLEFLIELGARAGRTKDDVYEEFRNLYHALPISWTYPQ